MAGVPVISRLCQNSQSSAQGGLAMTSEADDLSGWTFAVREVSNSVYNVRAGHSSGASIDLTDTCDPELLLTRAKESALSMQEDLNMRLSRR